MGLFSFTQEIAIDLGTANTVIIHNDKIVVDEPSVVALDKRTDKLLAVGEKARLMHGKTHENIRTIRPLRDGVIADFYAAEQMIRGMVKMVSSKSHWFSPSLLSMFCSSPSLKLLMFASSIFSSNSPARSFLISLSSKSFTSSSVCPCLGSPPSSNAE